MNPRVCVYGLWHLGSVTAACLADLGLDVTGLDNDAERVSQLADGVPPVAEPGLAELIQSGLAAGNLRFVHEPKVALASAEVLWITLDTPVDENDEADVEWVATQLDRVRPHVTPRTLVLNSSQVPVGFTRGLQRKWRSTDPTLEFACSPENLRLGQALDAFRNPARVVVGFGSEVGRERIDVLFAHLRDRIEWMSLESAEMTKHALNAFLATSVAYINEVARICEVVGADAAEVERGLRTEPRIGRKAYVTPGGPIAGGTLARDVVFLKRLAVQHGMRAPLLDGVAESNELHTHWAEERLQELLHGVPAPRVALLGLTYKPGTDTLRRSTAIELGKRLADAGMDVTAFDPAIRTLPTGMEWLRLSSSLEEVLVGADAAVVGTPWPEFSRITGEQLARAMRHSQVVDQTGFLAHLAADTRVQYVRVGRHPDRKALSQ